MICFAEYYLSVPLDIKIPHQFGAEKRINSKGYLKRQSFGLKPLTLRARREEMATVMTTPREKGAIMLTSGASGRINALLSLRMWRSLFMVINAFVLLLFLPFRRRKIASTASVTAAGGQGGVGGCGCGAGGSGMGKEERSVEKKGIAVVRVPAAMVPARKSALASAVVDKEVAARRTLAIKRVLEDDGKDSIREFMLLDAPRGVTLFTQSWTPAAINVRALVVVLHGLNEHSGRYNDFAKQLNANGYKVYGMDWIGHGGSDGLHAYVHSLDDAVSDMKLFIRKVVAENPGLPCFCFGHSTGGAIILKAALDEEVKTRIAGLVLTSPAVGVQPSHPIFAVLAPVVAFLLPRYQFSAANKRGAVVSRDPEALLAKYSDPLVFTGSIRVRTGYEILRITTYLQQNLKRLIVPFLVLHGTADAVTDPGASQKLHSEAASADKSIRLLEGFLHDLLFEPERQQIVEEIIEWLNQRL